MASPELLQRRLNEVADSLAATGHGLALLALGSVGREVARLDRFSDLDFFAIVATGRKRAFLDEPGWLAKGARVDWLFRNTPDGFKVLWADGVFGEMAVFEPDELQHIPFAPGRVVWAANGFDVKRLEPTNRGGLLPQLPGEAWARDELLSCLYVGLSRFRRGEKLSALRFVQGHCLDRLLELIERSTPAATGFTDPYDRLRRFEVRFPGAARLLPSLLGGYEATPRAARAFVEWLSFTGPVNEALRAQVLALAEDRP